MSPYVDVSDLDKPFADASDMDASVPDCECVAEIMRTDFIWTKAKPPERAFQWEFQIIEGDYTGGVVKKTSLLRSDLLRWLKIDLSRCGMRFATLSELQQHQRDLWGLTVQLKLVTKPDKKGKDRQNVWIQKTKDQENERSYEPPPPEEETPF